MNFRDQQSSTTQQPSQRTLISALPRVVLRMPSLFADPIKKSIEKIPAIEKQEEPDEQEHLKSLIADQMRLGRLGLQAVEEAQTSEEVPLIDLSVDEPSLAPEPSLLQDSEESPESLLSPFGTSEIKLEELVEQVSAESEDTTEEEAVPQQRLAEDSDRVERKRQVQGTQWRNRFFLSGIAASLLWMTYLAVNGTTFDSLINSILQNPEVTEKTKQEEPTQLAEAPAWQPETAQSSTPIEIQMIPIPFAKTSETGSPTFSTAPSFQPEVEIVGPVVEQTAPPVASNVQIESLPATAQSNAPLLTLDDLNVPQFDQDAYSSNAVSEKKSIEQPKAQLDLDSHWMKQEPTQNPTKVSLSETALQPEMNAVNGVSSSGYLSQDHSKNSIPSYYAPISPSHDDSRRSSQARLLGIEPTAPRTR